MSSLEEEFTTTYIVRVRSYGRPDKVRGETDKALGRALHFAFLDRFEYQRDGKRLVYDQFAEDGEHIGHDESVTTVEPDEPDEPDQRQRLKELAEKAFPNAAAGLDTILRSESIISNGPVQLGSLVEYITQQVETALAEKVEEIIIRVVQTITGGRTDRERH